jgi:signal transduction histidine kinase/pSer/pThr/pTyr-binding forkhead associated (FHA) protein
MVRYLIVDEQGSSSFEVGERQSVAIGRSSDNDVVLPYGLVSGRHAEVLIGPEGPVIRDLASKNGTWVNGERIHEPRQLMHGDRIIVGGQGLVFEVESPLAETSVSVLDQESETTQIHATIDPGGLKSAERSLAILNETGSLLLEAKDEAELTGRILDLVFDVLPAERGCVILREPGADLRTMAARSREGHTEDLAVPRSILDRVIREGIALLTSDARRDERFKRGHSVVLQGIRAAMCAPVRGKRSVLGAIYVDTRMLKSAFKPEDLELLTTLGIQAGITIENQRLLLANLKAERLAAIGGVVAGLSHDVRNILTSLKGGAYLLDAMLSNHENPDLREAWQIVRATTDTIAELVDDMVSYSKDREPVKDPTDVIDLVRRVATRFRERARNAGARIDVELDEGTGIAAVDANGIDRVLSNLIANALDVVPREGGRVEIRSVGLDGLVEITVKDNGPGVPEQNRERIFDLLFSTKGSRGTGFGLAVTRKIVTEHGGTVELVSGPGEGAQFRVRLPRS